MKNDFLALADAAFARREAEADAAVAALNEKQLADAAARYPEDMGGFKASQRDSQFDLVD
jgi:hypothetical protein